MRVVCYKVGWLAGCCYSMNYSWLLLLLFPWFALSLYSFGGGDDVDDDFFFGHHFLTPSSLSVPILALPRLRLLALSHLFFVLFLLSIHNDGVSSIVWVAAWKNCEERNIDVHFECWTLPPFLFFFFAFIPIFPISLVILRTGAFLVPCCLH